MGSCTNCRLSSQIVHFSLFSFFLPAVQHSQQKNLVLREQSVDSAQQLDIQRGYDICSELTTVRKASA